MDKLIKTNTVVTIKDKDARYLTASRDGALVHWTKFSNYQWSRKRVQWRVQWLEGPSMVEPGIWIGALNLWSIYNKAFAMADLASDEPIFIQTDRPPPDHEGGCHLRLTNIRNNGEVLDGALVVWRTVERQCTNRNCFDPVTLTIVKSPNYNAKLYSRGASPAGLTSSSLPGLQVGQVIIGAADNNLPRSYNSGGNVNYSGTQTNGDVRDADAIEYVEA